MNNGVGTHFLWPAIHRSLVITYLLYGNKLIIVDNRFQKRAIR